MTGRGRMMQWLFGVGLVVAMAGTASGQEFRSIQGIPTPPPPAERSASETWLSPPDRASIEAAVEGLFAAWNTPALRGLLSREFYEQTRLPEQLSVQIPRDARIRILALESWSMIEQHVAPGPTEWSLSLTNTVSVVVRSQVEFDEAGVGFRRLEGVSEYIFDMTETVPR